MTWYDSQVEFAYFFLSLISIIFHSLLFVPQEFSGVGGLTDNEDLETDMSKVPDQTLEILASCHALVFVDNKLVRYKLTAL